MAIQSKIILENRLRKTLYRLIVSSNPEFEYIGWDDILFHVKKTQDKKVMSLAARPTNRKLYRNGAAFLYTKSPLKEIFSVVHFGEETDHIRVTNTRNLTAKGIVDHLLEKLLVKQIGLNGTWDKALDIHRCEIEPGIDIQLNFYLCTSPLSGTNKGILGEEEHIDLQRLQQGDYHLLIDAGDDHILFIDQVSFPLRA